MTTKAIKKIGLFIAILCFLWIAYTASGLKNGEAACEGGVFDSARGIRGNTTTSAADIAECKKDVKASRAGIPRYR